MAKAFYTQDETKAALNVDDEGLKELSSSGRLTEYRDGQRLMYKGSQVEALVAEMGRGDAVDLSDTGGAIGLADSSGASGSAIGLAGGERSGSGPGIAADDTAGGFALSDSDAGVDPVMGSDMSASASGITIFGPDDSGIADPAAQTNLGDSSGEQVNLEGIGSGSGLLDLTQEPDDTSFGAETFDEIMPGESGMGQFFLTIDVTRFMPMETFKARMDELIDQIHTSPKSPGVSRSSSSASCASESATATFSTVCGQ